MFLLFLYQGQVPQNRFAIFELQVVNATRPKAIQVFPKMRNFHGIFQNHYYDQLPLISMIF